VPHVAEFVADVREAQQGGKVSDRADLVRLHFGAHLRARRQPGEEPGRGEAREGAREFRASARGQVAAEQVLLPSGRSPADDVIFRRRGAGERRERSGRLVQGHECRRGATRLHRPKATPAARCNGRPKLKPNSARSECSGRYLLIRAIPSLICRRERAPTGRRAFPYNAELDS